MEACLQCGSLNARHLVCDQVTQTNPRQSPVFITTARGEKHSPPFPAAGQYRRVTQTLNIAKARRRADRTHKPAVHRGKHIDEKKGGSHNWVTSQLGDPSFRTSTDFLTKVMASGLLEMCFMCCTNPSTAAARYGLPPWKTALALATSQRDCALSTVALTIGGKKGKEGEEDTRLRLFSLILLVFIALRWGWVLRFFLDTKPVV